MDCKGKRKFWQRLLLQRGVVEVIVSRIIVFNSH